MSNQALRIMKLGGSLLNRPEWPASLTRWLEAHKLPVFQNNEDVHTHECGEYVLQELQAGVSPGVVKENLRSKYLVSSTTQRLVAYRRYREQRGDYWTCEHLEQHHWEYLYSLVSSEQKLGRDQQV